MLNRVNQQTTVTSTPLTAAISANSEKIAIKLLDLGADAQTSFEEFQQTFMGDVKQSTMIDFFKQNFQQPIILATQMEMPVSARELLLRGADPSTLTTESNRLVGDDSMTSNFRGQTILDLVREKLEALLGYEEKEIVKQDREYLLEKKSRKIAEVTHDFGVLEKELNGKGAKTFQQLYPYITARGSSYYQPVFNSNNLIQTPQIKFEGDEEKYAIL